MYAHYPEVDGDKTTYWRETLLELTLRKDRGKERWICYQFTLNVCEMFALPLLDRLRKLIDELPDPAAQSLELAATFDDISVQSSQEDASAPESQDENFKKPRARGLNAELRNMIHSLQRQLEQQRQDAEQQRQEMKEQQREREAALLEQLAEQRKESKEREAKSEERQNELMKMLTEQSMQIKELLQKR